MLQFFRAHTISVTWSRSLPFKQQMHIPSHWHSTMARSRPCSISSSLIWFEFFRHQNKLRFKNGCQQTLFVRPFWNHSLSCNHWLPVCLQCCRCNRFFRRSGERAEHLKSEMWQEMRRKVNNKPMVRISAALVALIKEQCKIPRRLLV